jgi:hypothetical protein
MNVTEAIVFAKQRLAAEIEIYRRQVAEINSWHGVYVCDAQCDALRERPSKLRKAIKSVRANTVFGVGVRLVANSHQWDDDHHETFFSTLETVGKLSVVQFRLPPVRL